MRESELQEQIRQMCVQLGLYHYHARDSRGSAAGWPDWVIMSRRPGLSGTGNGIIFRELKSQSGQLTSEQKEIGYLLTAAGLSWEVWRPVDYIDGTIALQLAQLAGVKARAADGGLPLGTVGQQ